MGWMRSMRWRSRGMDEKQEHQEGDNVDVKQEEGEEEKEEESEEEEEEE